MARRSRTPGTGSTGVGNGAVFYGCAVVRRVPSAGKRSRLLMRRYADVGRTCSETPCAGHACASSSPGDTEPSDSRRALLIWSFSITGTAAITVEPRKNGRTSRTPGPDPAGNILKSPQPAKYPVPGSRLAIQPPSWARHGFTRSGCQALLESSSISRPTSLLCLTCAALSDRLRPAPRIPHAQAVFRASVYLSDPSDGKELLVDHAAGGRARRIGCARWNLTEPRTG